MKEISRLLEESRILNFVKNFNRNLLTAFFRSGIYNFFLKLNAFFRNVILKNAGESLFVRIFRTKAVRFKSRDAGLFVMLAVLFNTAIMMIFGKNIDLFSASARIFLLIFGIVLFRRK